MRALKHRDFVCEKVDYINIAKCFDNILLPFQCTFDAWIFYWRSKTNRQWVICYEYVMSMLWVCYEYVMRMLWVCFDDMLWVYYEDRLWVCYEYVMSMLWVCYGYVMGMLWVCYEYMLWVGYE